MHDCLSCTPPVQFVCGGTTAGVTWSSGTPAGRIAGCGATAQCGDEFQLAELVTNGGGIVGVSRHPGGPALTVSTTAGASFGPMRTLPELKTPSCQTSIINAKGTGAVDRLLISAPFSKTSRTNMSLSAGTATGSWSSVVQLSPSTASYGGYSALAELSNGDVLCMWEGPCRTSDPNGLDMFCLATIKLEQQE